MSESDFKIEDLNKRVNRVEDQLATIVPQVAEVADFVREAKKFLRHTKAIIAGIAGLNVASWSGVDLNTVTHAISMLLQAFGG